MLLALYRACNFPRWALLSFAAWLNWRREGKEGFKLQEVLQCKRKKKKGGVKARANNKHSVNGYMQKPFSPVPTTLAAPAVVGVLLQLWVKSLGQMNPTRSTKQWFCPFWIMPNFLIAVLVTRTSNHLSVAFQISPRLSESVQVPLNYSVWNSMRALENIMSEFMRPESRPLPSYVLSQESGPQEKLQTLFCSTWC